MALEIINEKINAEQLIGENKYQALISYDVIVNDNKPDVEKIISVSAYNNILRQETVQGKVVVEGMLNCTVLYTGDTDKLIEHLNAQIPYTQYIDIKGTEARMYCDVDDAIENIEAKIVNGRKVTISSVLNLNIKVFDKIEIDAAGEITGLTDIQILRDNIKLSNTIGRGVSQNIVKEDIEIPQNKLDISEILKADVKINTDNIIVQDEKVTIEGYVTLNIMYYTGEEVHPLENVVYELPFTQIVDVPGADESMTAKVRFYIDDSNYKIIEDENGKKRLIDAEILLKAMANVKKEEEKEVIVDAYSLMRSTGLNREVFNYDEFITGEESQVEIKDTLELSEPATSIYEIELRSIVTDYTVRDERILANGVLSFSVMYMTAGGDTIVTGEVIEAPFNITVDVPGIKEGMHVDIKVGQDKFTYELRSSRQVDVKVVLNANISVYESRSVELVTGVEEIEEELPERHSITVYVVQKDDELWNIAKRYRTTTDSILKTNKIQDNDIRPGIKLIIPKSVV